MPEAALHVGSGKVRELYALADDRLLLALTRAGVSREQSYEWVQRNAMKTWDEGGDFRSHVLADADIAKRLTREEVERVFSLDGYMRNVGKVFARVFADTQAGSP